MRTYAARYVMSGFEKIERGRKRIESCVGPLSISIV